MKYYIYILFVFVLFLSNGCEKHNSNNSTENNDSTKIVKLAKVNDHIITNKVLGKNANLFFSLQKKAQDNMIEKLINDELLIQYIFKEKNQTKIEDENIRAKRGLQLLEAESLSKTLAIVDSNISNIYEKEKDKYWHKELIEASNILVDTEKEAKDIIKELNSSKNPKSLFIKIAKEKSVGKAAKNGGYLGLFEKKIMVKEFQNALDNMEIKSYSKKPVKTKYGYHVIYLHNILPEGYFSLEEVKKDIVLSINKKRMNKWAYKKLKELRKDAKITYYQK